jgi:hypothetical protein
MGGDREEDGEGRIREKRGKVCEALTDTTGEDVYKG